MFMRQRALFNWKLRAIYLFLGAGLGACIAVENELPIGGTAAVFVSIGLFRIALEEWWWRRE